MLRTILNNDLFISCLFNVHEQKEIGKKMQRLTFGASHFNNGTLSKESRLSLFDLLHHCFLSGPFAYTSGVSFSLLYIYVIKEVYSDDDDLIRS
jgi:hypothetical protein